MSNEEFRDACMKLRAECMVQTDGKVKGNADGVIAIKEYFDYPGIIILWLLKEPWGDGDANQADDLSRITVASDYFSNRNGDGFQTYKPLIMLAGLMHGLSDFDAFTSKEAYCSFVESTSFVNCKKTPGATKSNDKQIGLFALKNRGLIEKQVLLYNPHVIIGGHTLRHFFPVCSSTSSIFEQIKLHQNGNNAVGLERIESYTVFGDKVSVENCRAIKKNGYDFGVYVGDKYLFIDADHPSYAKRADDYCSALFEIISNNVL